MGGHTLVGRLSRIWIQRGIVTATKCATVYRHFSEATVPERECGPRPVFASIYTPAFALQLSKNHGKTSVGVAEKHLTEQCWIRFVWSTWWTFYGRHRPVCWPSPTLSCASGDLGQSSARYLPSCWTKGFPAPANFEPKLSVRDLMWSVNNGTPKSSWICLLLTYQGAPVAARRHLDWIACSFLIGERAANLQTGHP
jgi:hypothetical protein